MARIVFLLILLLLALIASLGAGLAVGHQRAIPRREGRCLPFLTQFWLFITPIAYASSLLSEPWRTLYGLNPMAGVVEGFRWALLNTNTDPSGITIMSGVASVAMLISGRVLLPNYGPAPLRMRGVVKAS